MATISVQSFLTAAVLACACGCASSEPAAKTSPASPVDASADVEDGAAARSCAGWPGEADTYDAAGGTGCAPDAGIYLNGVNQCHSDEYSLACGFDRAPDGLGCRNLKFPAVSDYCCPCQ
jgi:hypothetical protein